MNMDAEWTMAVLRVIQATNVVLVHTPDAAICCSVRDLDINSLQSQLSLSQASFVAVTHELTLAIGNSGEHQLEVDQFIWSVLHMHNALFCPHFGCKLCVRHIKETKGATCIALVRSPADVPACLESILEEGVCLAFIHAREVPIIPAQNTLGLLSQKSSITTNLLLTTLTKRSGVDLDTLHELIEGGTRKLSMRSKLGILAQE